VKQVNIWRRYSAALRYPQYRRYWFSAVIAGAGVWGLLVARAALAYQISDDSAAAVGLVTFAAMIPFVIVPLVSGVLADKFDRRYLVAAAHITNVFFAMSLAWMYFFSDIQLWHLVILSLVSGIARGVQMPASSALVPNLVPRDDLLNAIALNNMSLQGSRLAGGVLTGVFIGTTWGIGGAFVLAVVMYAVAALMVLSINTPSTGEIPKGANIWTIITAGVVYSYQNRAVGLMLILVGLHCGLTMAFESVYPAHAARVLGQDGSAFAHIIAFFGGGAVLGVVSIAGIRDERTKGRALLVAGFGSSAGLILMGFSTNIVLGLVAAFLTGLFQAPFMSLSMTFIQTVVPDAIRGRVSSLFTMSALSLMAFANLGYGWLTDMYGSTPVLIIPAVTFTGVMLAALLFVGTLKTVFLKGFDAVASQ
jgi:MFS family permease